MPSSEHIQIHVHVHYSINLSYSSHEPTTDGLHAALLTNQPDLVRGAGSDLVGTTSGAPSIPFYY